MNEIWILGANGRCGRAVASELAARQHALVLVGRDAGRLREAADDIGGSTRVVVSDSIADIASQIARSGAAVVVNTIGPFTRSAVPIARACPRRCHCVDGDGQFGDTLAATIVDGSCAASGGQRGSARRVYSGRVVRARTRRAGRRAVHRRQGSRDG